MSFLKEEEVIAAIQPVLEEEDLKDGEVQISRGSQKGEGYVSQIVQVDVKGKDRSLNLIVKCRPPEEVLRKSLVVGDMFHVETYFYDKVVPAFKDFQKKIGTSFDLVPKCYRTINDLDTKLLIFENLKVQGYRVWDKKEEMDEEHLVMMLKHYGKFHAISAAMRQLDPEGFEELTKDKSNFYKQDEVKDNEEIYNIFLANVQKMESFFYPKPWDEDWLTAVWLKDRIKEILTKIGGDMKGDCPVISHGDCWYKNMMFKYEDTSNPTKPTQAVICDFQGLHLNSPAMDFCCFFYTYASEDMLYDEDEYLKVYHNSFAEHLSLFGLDVETVYPFESLEKEWSFWALYGVLVASAYFKAMLQEKLVEDGIQVPDKDMLQEKSEEKTFQVAGNKMKLFDWFGKDLKSEVEDEKLKNLVFHLHRHQIV